MPLEHMWLDDAISLSFGHVMASAKGLVMKTVVVDYPFGGEQSLTHTSPTNQPKRKGITLKKMTTINNKPSAKAPSKAENDDDKQDGMPQAAAPDNGTVPLEDADR